MMTLPEWRDLIRQELMNLRYSPITLKGDPDFQLGRATGMIDLALRFELIDPHEWWQLKELARNAYLMRYKLPLRRAEAPHA